MWRRAGTRGAHCGREKVSESADDKQANSEFGKVAVLMGGYSAEADISRASGAVVLAALLSSGIDAHSVEAADDLLGTLGHGEFDRVFVVMHGRGGEDGVIQGFLETLGLPYTGSGVMASSLAMDKRRSKHVWRSAGLPTPQWLDISAGVDADAVVATLGLPLAVKPVREGSSYGISKVTSIAEIEPARDAALPYDNAVMVEQWIVGSEYTAAIIDGEVLPLIKLETSRIFYDYEAKYTDNGTDYICPCGLDQATEGELQELALRAFDALGAKGWGRVDFMLDAEDQPWLIELNTVPGMTDHSLVPMAARAAGGSIEQLVVQILSAIGTGEPG